ncbi:hypothetical protein BD311DRAFT_376951 [Dichomitus squalens]|uniref:Uncharacterized protein n=1 Tax=Dichomitus squalens TaxID=114155 RepID=A0A4V2K048_9APHY|nr:hypothetical protein BD311DRAFT_376951 [Dichomitus squalens]
MFHLMPSRLDSHATLHPFARTPRAHFIPRNHAAGHSLCLCITLFCVMLPVYSRRCGKFRCCRDMDSFILIH